jgi:sulfide:quinone oxidoreductase
MRPGYHKPLHVLVAGGGVAALEATLALRKIAEERVTVEILAPEDDFTYRPLAVGEPFHVGEVRRFPLKPLVEAAGARLRPGVIVSVDPDRHVVVTGDGDTLSYDVLLLALGARPLEAVPGALTFRGPTDGPALVALLDEALTGAVRRLAFAVPGGVAWPVPLYELALLTWSYLTDRGAMGREFALVTPEEAPLALFGTAASRAIHELLTIRGIALQLRTTPVRFAARVLHLAPAGELAVDRVVALPRLEGLRLPGIPHDAEGFIRTDEYGRVPGLDDIYAAGDLTSFPIKQGGIATQQADAVATAIAVQAGALAKATPFRPVLRGKLLTGIFPRYLRADLDAQTSAVSTEPLWWPPAKIVGKHLAPFLAARLGVPAAPTRPESGIAVAVALDPTQSR